MRVFRGVVVVLMFVALCLIVALTSSCAPAEARAAGVNAEGTLFVVAAGDTLKATMGYRVSGSPDSVAWIFTARNAPLIRLVRAAPPNGTSLAIGPANLIPSPALAEGDTVTVQACPMAYKKGQTYTGFACGSKLYQKPIVPPVVLPDSLTVISLHIMLDPFRVANASTQGGRGVYVQTTTTAQFCVALQFKDTKKYALRTLDRADTTCARHYATTIGQLQRAQPVTYTNGVWVVGSLSPARTAVLDAICIDWQGTGGTITDDACGAGAAGPGRRAFDWAGR